MPVEDVEEIRAKFDSHAFLDRKVLGDAHVLVKDRTLARVRIGTRRIADLEISFGNESLRQSDGRRIRGAPGIKKKKRLLPADRIFPLVLLRGQEQLQIPPQIGFDLAQTGIMRMRRGP